MSPVALADWWPVARGAGARMRLGNQLEEPTQLPAHAGLWLDRMLAEPRHEKGQEWLGRRQLYETAVKALAPQKNPAAVQAYRPLFDAWRAAMEKPEPGIARHLLTVEAQSRILLHPASNGTVTEGSILLHHTYGVPYLPGSALKGVLRSRLDRFSTFQDLRDLTSELLGDLQRTAPAGSPEGEAPGLASLVDFYDALWIPEAPPEAEESWSPLAMDIVNPHHPEYYTGGGNGRRPPSDMDEPVPVHRLSLRRKAKFLIVAEAPDAPELAPWLSWLIDDVLVAALAEDGIGAWTSAGYGRLERLGGKPDLKKPARASQEPPPAEWQTAHVFYDAGSGELRASLADGGKAWALHAPTQELLAGLPEGMKTAIVKRRRTVLAEVKVNPEGLNWRLVAVREVAK